jgi:hypothetical protein
MVVFVSEKYGDDVKREIAEEKFNVVDLGKVTKDHSEVVLRTYKGSLLHL